MIFILFNVYLSALLIATVTGVMSVGFNKQAPIYIKVLPWFILLTFVVEVLAYCYAAKTGSNLNIFNVFLVIQHLFYSFILYGMLKGPTVRKRLLYTVCVYLPIAVALIFIQGINFYNSMVYFLGALMLSFYSGYFLYELFRVPGNENLLRYPSFWIACGILLYNSCTIPLVIPWPVLMHCTPFELKIIHIVLTTVYFTSYSMFTVAFIYHFLLQFPRHFRS